MRNLIINFHNESEIQRLNSYYNRTTLFNILGIERRELSHSSFLKWLLDINGSHNLKDEPLKKFLRQFAKTDTDNNNDIETMNTLLTGNYIINDFNIETEKSTKGNNNIGRIDIFATFSISEKKCVQNKKNSGVVDFRRNIVVIIENKIDASESNNQTTIYEEWTENENEYKEHTKVYIFLSPNEEDCSSKSFIKISYQDILEFVIEPLLNIEMDIDTKIILEDYIVNLGQARKQIKENGKEEKLETILAVSSKNRKTFSEILTKYRNLLDTSLVAYYNNTKNKDVNTKKKDVLKNIFKENLNDFKKNIKDNKLESLLSSFWESNKMLLHMIYLYGNENDSLNEYFKDLFGIKASNRDNAKYIVYNRDNTIINETDKTENFKAVPKSIASFYIFKAWVNQNPRATIDDIRKAFPVKECAKHYEKVYQYLFYEYDKDERIKYTDDLEKYPDRAYIDWDFYKGDLAEKYHLVLDGIKVMTQKFWSKRKVNDEVIDDFEILVKYAEDHYGIKVEKA